MNLKRRNVMKSAVERLNEIKEKELEKKQHQIAEGEIIKEPDLRALIRRKGSYSLNSGDKARTNKGPIGIDRDPGL
jgi:hypothetical protein